MIRKSANEIAKGLREGDLGSDEAFDWLSTATATELKEFIRWLGIFAPVWVAFARDALNVVLANENIKLQTDIKDMTATMKKLTKWITGLTVIIVFLTFFQAYSSINTFFNDIKIFSDTPKAESNTNQSNKTKHLTDKNNDTLKKTEIINHKKNP
jgi:hypothetical protein